MAIFGVDFTAREVITVEGKRFPVQQWFDCMGQNTEDPNVARSCTFMGPGGLWFALDIASCHFPSVVN